MPQRERDPEPTVVRQILNYFVRNPKAVDSLEGVARWRLLEEHIQRSLEETDAALAWLVSQGFLQEEKPLGSGRLFRLDPGRHLDAVDFLAEQDRTEEKKKA